MPALPGVSEGRQLADALLSVVATFSRIWESPTLLPPFAHWQQELNHIKAQDVSMESYAAVGPDQQLMSQTPGAMDTPARRDWTRAHQLR